LGLEFGESLREIGATFFFIVQNCKMKQQYFQQIECTLHSAEYVRIKSWLMKNEPSNPLVKEISQVVEHSYSPRPFQHQFSDLDNETLCRVFLIIKKDLNKKAK
jgi:hypothetical protein